MMENEYRCCPECGNEDLEWHYKQRSNSGVLDGSLKISEIHTVFYLRCNYCSAILKIVYREERDEGRKNSIRKMCSRSYPQ